MQTKGESRIYRQGALIEDDQIRGRFNRVNTTVKTNFSQLHDYLNGFKLEKVKAILSDLEPGSKIVIYSKSRVKLDLLESILNECCDSICNYNDKTGTLINVLNQFKADLGTSVLLIYRHTLLVGLNLEFVNCVIDFDD